MDMDVQQVKSQQTTSYNKLENIKLVFLSFIIQKGYTEFMSEINVQIASSTDMCRSTCTVYRTRAISLFHLSIYSTYLGM